MIAVFKQVILCVTAASLFGAVVLSLVQQRAQKEIVRIAVGIVLILSLLTPLRSLHFPKLSEIMDSARIQSAGEDELYEQTISEEFCRQAEDYLEQQAQQNSITCSIEIQTEIDENELKITGAAVRCSSEEEERLSQLMTDQLGIEQNQIQFIGEDDEQ
ncbi:MAG: hypothetical protein ACI4PM_05920 [Butyricicoccus sp.]